MTNQNEASKIFSFLFKDFKLYVCFWNENLLPKNILCNTIKLKKCAQMFHHFLSPLSM